MTGGHGLVAIALLLGGGCTLSPDPIPEGQSPDAGASDPAADAAVVGDGADAGAVEPVLTGSASAPQVGFGSPIDFASAGSSDWVHWGLAGDVAAYNHKAGVAAPISNYTQLGEAALLATNCCIETGFSWADGAPTASASNAIGGVYVDTANPSGDGFRFTVPADTSMKTLRVYAGNWCVRARLDATLSDGSAAPLADTSFDVPTAVLQNAIYTITYRAASPGQSLQVDLTIAENHCIEGDVGELHLFAAAR